MANKNSKSSARWLREHFSDPYVKEAQKAGYRSRAIFKLMELDKRDRLFKPGMIVVDLGAAPGGWSQWVAQKVMPKGRIIALDILEMDPIPQVEFIQGDFSDQGVLDQLTTSLNASQPDWVISDIAPNLSGDASIDIPRAMYLVELVVEFACQTLKKEGGLVMKVFQGEGFDALILNLKSSFTSVTIRKPKASRGRSREVYIVAKGKR